MKCDVYRRFEKGRIGRDRFDAHLQVCPECRKRVKADRVLLEKLRGRRPALLAPDLWGRIESALREEQAAERSAGRRFRARPLFPVWTTAAVLAVAALLWVVIRPRPLFPGSGLLEQRALARVEKAESSYSRAIRELEQVARPRLEAMDLERMFLYQDKLSVIDEQIEACREELDANPGNTHVHRYLMAALRDKKQTLEDLLEKENAAGPGSNRQGGIHEPIR